MSCEPHPDILLIGGGGVPLSFGLPVVSDKDGVRWCAVKMAHMSVARCKEFEREGRRECQSCRPIPQEAVPIVKHNAKWGGKYRSGVHLNVEILRHAMIGTTIRSLAKECSVSDQTIRRVLRIGRTSQILVTRLAQVLALDLENIIKIKKGGHNGRKNHETI